MCERYGATELDYAGYVVVCCGLSYVIVQGVHSHMNSRTGCKGNTNERKQQVHSNEQRKTKTVKNPTRINQKPRTRGTSRTLPSKDTLKKEI